MTTRRMAGGQRVHYIGWTRDDEAETDVTIGYTFSPGCPAHYGSMSYPGHPAEGPEVELVGVWEKDAVITKGSAPTITLTPAEEAKARDWIVENHSEPERDDD